MSTIYYVSNSASNGFAMGNDSNDGLSKSTPWVTLGKFGSTASLGDVGIVNIGDYGVLGNISFVPGMIMTKSSAGLSFETVKSSIVDGQIGEILS